MASLQKQPKKGILKTSTSFDKAEAHAGKEMKWDEMNILATHHPPDKDYGHMKIDEPPTPYSKSSDPEDDDEEESNVEHRRGSFGKKSDIDPASLSSKLEGIDNAEEKRGRLRRVSTEDEESSDEEMTEEQLEKKKKFEQKRKLHYNEFKAVKLAKQLMEEDDDEDSGNGNSGANDIGESLHSQSEGANDSNSMSHSGISSTISAETSEDAAGHLETAIN